jgi:hypothetical protein
VLRHIVAFGVVAVGTPGTFFLVVAVVLVELEGEAAEVAEVAFAFAGGGGAGHEVAPRFPFDGGLALRTVANALDPQKASVLLATFTFAMGRRHIAAWTHKLLAMWTVELADVDWNKDPVLAGRTILEILVNPLALTQSELYELIVALRLLGHRGHNRIADWLRTLWTHHLRLADLVLLHQTFDVHHYTRRAKHMVTVQRYHVLFDVAIHAADGAVSHDDFAVLLGNGDVFVKFAFGKEEGDGLPRDRFLAFRTLTAIQLVVRATEQGPIDFLRHTRLADIMETLGQPLGFDYSVAGVATIC